MKRGEQDRVSGVTVYSLSVVFFALLVTAVMLVLGETILGQGWHYNMHIFAIPAMSVFLGLCGLAFLLHRFFNVRLLTRAEMTCVFFMLMIAVPIMGLGFWTNFIWMSSTFPVQGDFDKIDTVSDRLWPHGPNLLDHGLNQAGANNVTASGDVRWVETEYESGERASIPVLHCENPQDSAWVRIRVPVEKEGRPFLTFEQRYLLSLLARGAGFGPDTTCYGRVYYDDEEAFAFEAFSGRPGNEINSIHKTGFKRVGVYGIEFAPSIRDHVYIEFRLEGSGTVEFADPKLMCVDAYESLFRGRRTITAAEAAGMRGSERAGVVVPPDSLFSVAGIRYVLGGFIPVRAWASPVLSWLGFILLFVLAGFSLALIFRRQWINNERYPLPVAQIPMTLLGINQPECADGAPPSIWRNRTMWVGFGLCLFWSIMRFWSVYNTDVPNMHIEIQLKPYFTDPGWGRMWNFTNFSISTIVLSLAIFMELNVLLSLVIGFFLFISLHWLGEATGWAIGSTGNQGMGVYPYAEEQLVATFLTYGAITLFYARKYLWKTVKQAVRGGARIDPAGQDAQAASDGVDDEREPFSYRTAYLLLLGSFVGALAWAHWAGIGVRAMAVLFSAMVLFSLVAMKLRAECGTPLGWFGTGTRLLVPLAGGITFLGAKGAMFASWTTLGMVLLFILPGLLLEFLEIARRIRIKSRHILYCVVLGTSAGMLIGGWVFLSSLYGIGSDTTSMRIWFDGRPWAFFPDDEFQRVADARIKQESLGAAAATADAAPISEAAWGYIGAGAATAAVTVLRHIYPGFWFHPAGIVLAASAYGFGMLRYWTFNIWGSLLAAWLIRLLVLKIGGAAMVRNVLFPFFIGVFMATFLAETIVFAVNAYYFFLEPAVVRQVVVL
ncbi:MAG: hypothetical protein NTZ09_16535 [Candidatus Hydrogenedentes bacterium]|nr:hypothetical protein [Candidatus Hydrogenedentota bacterium]